MRNIELTLISLILVQSVHLIFKDIHYQCNLLLLDSSFYQDIQYYIYDTGNMLSYALILYFFMKESEGVRKNILKVLFYHSIFQIVVYWTIGTIENVVFLLSLIYLSFIIIIVRGEGKGTALGS